MRVEATSKDGRRCICVQAHQSFRRCVAQSAAEFVLHLLESSWGSRYRVFCPKAYEKTTRKHQVGSKKMMILGLQDFKWRLKFVV